MSDSGTIWTGQFWKASAERIIFTFLQAYFGTILAMGAAATFNVLTFDWLLPLGPALGAALLSLVKCVIAGNFGNNGPSAANETLSNYPKISPSEG